MAFNGRTDEANQFSLRGTVTSDTFPALIPFIDIVVNRRFVARVPGQKFSFNPFEALSPGLNVVELFVAGSDQLLENGVHHISGDLPKDPPTPQEPGGPFDLFLDEVEVLAGPELAGMVLAIGSHLGKAVRNRGHACKEAMENGTEFDLILAAHSCEHWFPSIARELGRIYEALSPAGMVCLDFPTEDSSLLISRGAFDSAGGTFRRLYSEVELRYFFLEAGLEIVDIVKGEPDRVIVAARKPEVTD